MKIVKKTHAGKEGLIFEGLEEAIWKFDKVSGPRSINKKPFGNLNIGISELEIASASAFKYKHCLLDSCKCLVLAD